jgi:hypothetical protein
MVANRFTYRTNRNLKRGNKMSISYRVTFQGAWELCAYVNGHFETMQYMGYTKREATQLFRQHIQELKGY